MRMPFLATMPTPMIAPRKAHDVERGPGDPKRARRADECEHGAEDDGDGLVEAAEFDDEHREHEGDAEDQHDEQAAA
jgi:hypothetical protein